MTSTEETGNAHYCFDAGRPMASRMRCRHACIDEVGVGVRHCVQLMCEAGRAVCGSRAPRGCASVFRDSFLDWCMLFGCCRLRIEFSAAGYVSQYRIHFATSYLPVFNKLLVT